METKKQQHKKRTQRDYNLAFKLQVISEVEKGELTYKQAQFKYGIQGRSTVLTWLRKMSTLNWKELPTLKQKKTPEQRIKELEALLLREKEKVHVLNTAIDIADELLKTDIRKKFMPGQSKKQKPQS
jgi:transposase-like protein